MSISSWTGRQESRCTYTTHTSCDDSFPLSSPSLLFFPFCFSPFPTSSNWTSTRLSTVSTWWLFGSVLLPSTGEWVGVKLQILCLPAVGEWPNSAICEMNISARSHINSHIFICGITILFPLTLLPLLPLPCPSPSCLLPPLPPAFFLPLTFWSFSHSSDVALLSSSFPLTVSVDLIPSLVVRGLLAVTSPSYMNVYVHEDH